MSTQLDSYLETTIEAIEVMEDPFDLRTCAHNYRQIAASSSAATVIGVATKMLTV